MDAPQKEEIAELARKLAAGELSPEEFDARYRELSQAEPAPNVAMAGGSAPHRYTILPGDTLSSIANRFGVDVTALLAANAFRGDAFHVGAEVVIPGPATPEAAAAAPDEEKSLRLERIHAAARKAASL
jgi:LysM repeat protein